MLFWFCDLYQRKKIDIKDNFDLNAQVLLSSSVWF
jgi:hypothetical protein